MKPLIWTIDPKVARIAIAKLFKLRHRGGFVIYDWLIGAPVNERRTVMMLISAQRFERLETAKTLAAEFSQSQPGRFSVMCWFDFCRGAISKLAAQSKGIKSGIK